MFTVIVQFACLYQLLSQAALKSLAAPAPAGFFEGGHKITCVMDEPVKMADFFPTTPPEAYRCIACNCVEGEIRCAARTDADCSAKTLVGGGGVPSRVSPAPPPHNHPQHRPHPHQHPLKPAIRLKTHRVPRKSHRGRQHQLEQHELDQAQPDTPRPAEPLKVKPERAEPEILRPPAVAHDDPHHHRLAAETFGVSLEAYMKLRERHLDVLRSKTSTTSTTTSTTTTTTSTPTTTTAATTSTTSTTSTTPAPFEPDEQFIEPGLKPEAKVEYGPYENMMKWAFSDAILCVAIGVEAFILFAIIVMMIVLLVRTWLARRSTCSEQTPAYRWDLKQEVQAD